MASSPSPQSPSQSLDPELLAAVTKLADGCDELRRWALTTGSKISTQDPGSSIDAIDKSSCQIQDITKAPNPTDITETEDRPVEVDKGDGISANRSSPGCFTATPHHEPRSGAEPRDHPGDPSSSVDEASSRPKSTNTVSDTEQYLLRDLYQDEKQTQEMKEAFIRVIDRGGMLSKNLLEGLIESVMDKGSRVIVVGAGIFGLSAAYQLASEGYQNVLVLDRHVPPAPDASSNDISRIVRFDYADEDYLDIAHEAYLKWRDNPKYKGIFYPMPYILACNEKPYGQSWVEKTTAALTKRQLPFEKLRDGADARKKFPTLTGELASPGFVGYTNSQAGWADATKGTTQLRDEYIQAGVSFISGRAGTVVGFDIDPSKKIKAVRTLAGSTLEGDLFTAGAWVSSLVPMYGSALATAQALGHVRLTDGEMEKYKDLPIYVNCATGFFNFPPHEDTKMLKVAVHGWGYTRDPESKDLHTEKNKELSMPPLPPRAERANFVPGEAEARLRDGLREIVPELGDRPFDKLALCWYTDTPTGDFIMDFHPDYTNLFVGGGCSGHAFKFLPVLSKYMGQAIHKTLPVKLSEKWRFRMDFQRKDDAFQGDGSRGGPLRRKLNRQESAKL